jgi:heme/copper-type cytochrome/quinol oxidase subunit 2
MRTEVEVVSAEEYEQFLEQLEAGIQAAEDEVTAAIESGEGP